MPCGRVRSRNASVDRRHGSDPALHAARNRRARTARPYQRVVSRYHVPGAGSWSGVWTRIGLSLMADLTEATGWNCGSCLSGDSLTAGRSRECLQV